MLSNLKCTQKCLRLTGQKFQRGFAHQTHYEVLKVPRTASSAQIKKAYIQRCKELHPDTNRSDPQTHNKFVRLNEAYSCLSKASSKTDYDRKLNMGINVMESYQPPAPRPYSAPRPDEQFYDVYKQRYYGASREERARGEREYYRRIYEEQLKDQKDKATQTKNSNLFNGGLVVFTIILIAVINQAFSFRAEAERDYWRQYHKEQETEKEPRVNFANWTLGFLFLSSILFTGAALRNRLAYRRNMVRREAQFQDRVYFPSGGSYPRTRGNRRVEPNAAGTNQDVSS